MSKEKRRVPKLRFPGFTEDWEQRKLGECMNSFAYGLNAAAKEYDGMHKYIRITDIDDETHNFIQSNLTSPDIDFNMDVSDYKLNVGDIVFARTGASVGKTYLYNPNDGDLYYAGFLIRGKVKEDCDAGFIYQNTLTKDYDSFIKITSQRSGQPGVNSKEYATFRLNIPCKDEQEQISKVLNSLDELFTLHQRKLDNLKLKKKALLQKLFPKNGERYPELRFPGFTDTWEQRKLGDYLIQYTEITTQNNQYPVLTSSRKGLFFQTDYYDGNQIASKDNTGYNIVPYGYFTYRHMSDDEIFHFNINYIVDKGIVSTLYPVFTTKNLNSNYLQLQLNYGSEFRKYAVLLKQGGSRTYMYFNKLKDLKLTISTSIDEQEIIAKFFISFEKLITLHQRKLDHLKLQKKALLQQMFV